MATKSRKGASGSGTIRKRPDGRWEGRVTVGRDPKTGRQKQKSVYGATQREVRQKIQQIAVKIDSGDYVEPSKTTLAEWLEEWLAEHKTNLKYSSVSTYRALIANHIVPEIGSLPLQKITPVTLQRFFNREAAKGLSANTLALIRAIIAGAFACAERLGLVRKNPCAVMSGISVPRPKIDPLSRSELVQLLEELQGSPYYHAVALMVFTGLRPGELIGLTWDRIDYDRRLLVVDRQLKYENGRWVFASPKSGRSRFVPMPEAIASLLKDRRKVQLSDRLAAGSAWHEDVEGLVFTTSLGSQYIPYTFRTHLKKAAIAIGRPDITPKSLRHTYAVDSLLAMTNPKAVQGALGHHSASFTLNTYAHYTDEMRKDAAERMDAFIAALNSPVRVK